MSSLNEKIPSGAKEMTCAAEFAEEISADEGPPPASVMLQDDNAKGENKKIMANQRLCIILERRFSLPSVRPQTRFLTAHFFDGKAHTFTFKRYCERLNNAFTDLEESGETVNVEHKVRILLRGIVDPTLEAAMNQVLATATLHTTFESAVNYIAQFADRKSSMDTNRTRNLSSLQIQRGRGGNSAGRGCAGGGRFGTGRGRGNRSNVRLANRGGHSQGRGAGGSITDRYYSPDEWMRLSPEDQQRVRDLRTQRDRVRGMSAVASYNERNLRPRIEQTDPQPPIQVENDMTTITSNL
jgi:hypothetical protein